MYLCNTLNVYKNFLSGRELNPLSIRFSVQILIYIEKNNSGRALPILLDNNSNIISHINEYLWEAKKKIDIRVFTFKEYDHK